MTKTSFRTMLRVMVKWLGAFFVFGALAVPAFAGGWHSSGGELFQDETNPWFVKNTTHVNYCIQVDSASMTVSKTAITALVKNAITYWQNEFGKVGFTPQKGFFQVGNQEFSEIDCTTGVADVQFLFGYGTLNADQIAYLKTPEKYVGVAVRTDYDYVNLRGKGFVYIASDIGPHRYLQDDTNLIDQAWSHDKILNYALLHEIGHIFGLPHVGSGVMSEVFLENILEKNISDIYSKNPIESFFTPDNHLESCGDGNSFSFFNAPAVKGCLTIDFSSVYQGTVSFKAADAPSAQAVTKLGLLHLNGPDLSDYRLKPAIFLHLTKEQKVFTLEETAFKPFLVGPVFVDYGSSGIFITPKENKPIYAHFTPTSLTLIGPVNKDLKPVFDYESLIDLSLLAVPN